MSPFVLFGVQFSFSLLAMSLIAAWYVAPRLATRNRHDALVPLLLVHVFRYTPLTLLVPGQIDPAVPDDVANAIAYGDLTSAVLALVALLLVRYRAPAAVAAVWLFTVVGVTDIGLAVYKGVGAQLYEYAIGFNWYILNFYVPMLMITHVMIVGRLLAREAKPA